MRVPVEERRRALVAAAIRVIARDGVAGATTRAIVAEAGMKLASFHYAFDSRDALLSAVVAAVIEQEGDEAEARLVPMALLGDQALTMQDVVVAGLDRYIDLLVADPQREQALLELALYAMRANGAVVSATEQYSAYLQVARHTLEAGAVATGRRWTVPIDEAARLLVTLTDGLTTTWLADRDTDATRRTARAAAGALARLTEPETAPADDCSPDPLSPGTHPTRAHPTGTHPTDTHQTEEQLRAH